MGGGERVGKGGRGGLGSTKRGGGREQERRKAAGTRRLLLLCRLLLLGLALALGAVAVLVGVGRVAGLDLARLAREDDEARLVGLEALDVELERLLGLVAAAVVDGDADREGLLGADAGLLELGLGEAAARTELAVVADRRGTDSRAEELNRAEAGLGSLGLACDAARVLLARLVEPRLDARLPVLAEVVAVEDVVLAETHLGERSGSWRTKRDDDQ